MKPDEFYSTMQKFIHRRPFFPFVVELKDGRRLIIEKPAMAFNDEGAGFLDPVDGALVDFSNDEVLEIKILEQETPV